MRVNGEQLHFNGHATDYISKAAKKAHRAGALLTTALDATGHHQIAAHLVARTVIAVVGGRVLVEAFAPGSQS
jgi:hypothetical protein